jgi:hypothetical protein
MYRLDCRRAVVALSFWVACPSNRSHTVGVMSRLWGNNRRHRPWRRPVPWGDPPGQGLKTPPSLLAAQPPNTIGAKTAAMNVRLEVSMVPVRLE